MNKQKSLCLIGVVCAVLLSTPAEAQDKRWEKYEKYSDAGTKAGQKGKYTEAEKQFRAAVQEAEKLGAEDPRLARSLHNLATTYAVQKRYPEARFSNAQLRSTRRLEERNILTWLRS